ncbi:MAG: helix-turn-helix transcriptional regulator [Bacilli bacterium]
MMSSLSGQRIRELRQERGLTQTELAKGIVTPSMISQIEAGKAHPSDSLLKELAKRLDVPEDDLSLTPAKDEALSGRLEVIGACLALGRLQEAEDLLQSVFDPPSGALELHYLHGKLLLLRRRFSEAFAALDQALHLARDQRRSDFMPELLMCQGDVLFAIGELDVAIHVYEQALLIWRQRVAAGGIVEAQIAMRLSEAHRAKHDTKRAREYAEQAEERLSVGARSRQIAGQQLSQAIRTLDEGRGTKARRLAAEARAIFDVYHWLESSIEAELLLARQARDCGDLLRAHRIVDEWNSRGTWFASDRFKARMYFLKSELSTAEARIEDALATAREALQLDDEPSQERIDALSALAKADRGLTLEEAIAFAHIARRDAIELKKFPEAANIGMTLAQLHIRNGQPELARKSVEPLPFPDLL